MLWFVVMHLFSTLLDLNRISRLSEHDKDLEILLLRQQLGIAERKLHKPVRASRAERLTLAAVTIKLKSSSNRTIEHLRQIGRPPLLVPSPVLSRSTTTCTGACLSCCAQPALAESMWFGRPSMVC